MSAWDNLGGQFNRGSDIEVCEGCGATTDWSKETNPKNPVEGGLCENCFRDMPMGRFMEPSITESGKPSWSSSDKSWKIDPNHMN